MSVSPFRISLIVDGEYISAWQYLMLERLLASPHAVLVGVVFRQPVATTLSQRLNAALLQGLHYLDGRLFSCKSTAQTPTSFLPLLGDVGCYAHGSKRYQAFVSTQRVDVALELTGQAVLPDMVASATHGVWRHFYGNPAHWQDDYTNIREYARRQDEIVSGVVRYMAGQAAADCVFYATTSTDKVSINRGVERTLWKMADFIPQRLHELATVGEAVFQRNMRERVLARPLSSQDAVASGLITTCRIALRYPSNFLRKLYKFLFRQEQWILLTTAHGNVTELGLLENFHKWIPPRDRFWADPFVVEHAGEQYIFFEELIYTRGIGHLACVRLQPDGSHTEPVKILEKPYHLSYPFVFKYQGQYYLIPETAGNHTVEVYRCEEFPHRWVFEKNLMEGVEAYDATLQEYEGRWWMFVSMRSHQSCSPNEALYLFHADDPLSTQWQAHPQNPVVASAAQARPAGRMFTDAEQLYRPSQNCAGVYGRGLNLNRITQLDQECYREEVVSSYLPDGDFDMNGMHTLGIGRGLSVSDAVYIHRRLGRLDHWIGKVSGFIDQLVWKHCYVLLVLPLTFLWLGM
ncbi:MAG: hypothetical protein BWK73_42395 [Thiothrix lacustris]|uniref:Glucosamine inositolphosphorylceramide transferase 1 N-terminal domain-containing protein n=1 Tax=Thiothrix lacustris TaxID=525917 RepID=A0A1Y1QCE8_9GAMM|nr:MAG: hypothetical protein BWK73_42395 [Thiothrix lacustris]